MEVFPRAARADERRQLSRLDAERDSVQRPLPNFVGPMRIVRISFAALGSHPHRVEYDLALHRHAVERHGIGCVRNLLLKVQVAENALEQRYRNSASPPTPAAAAPLAGTDGPATP